MSPRSEWRFNIAGWLLFTVSAMLFIWSAVSAGDWISGIASLFFLIACLVFLVPAWRQRPSPDGYN
jgi:uncharacterized ion transporter superfamily protein YfcC